jgi:sensory rhodopsin
MMATTIVYWLAVVAFVIGTAVVLALRGALDGSPHKDALTYLAVIPLGAGLAYVAMALNLGMISANGFTLNAPRYIDWLITTPLLIGFVGYVAGAPRSKIAGSMFADVGMIATGVGAVVTQGPVRWVLFGLSSILYLGLLWYLYRGFREFLGTDPGQIGLYTLLKNHIALLWIAYPLVWFASPKGVGFATAAGVSLTFAFLDVLAKVPYVYFFYMYRGYFMRDRSTGRTSGSTDSLTDPEPAEGD